MGSRSYTNFETVVTITLHSGVLINIKESCPSKSKKQSNPKAIVLKYLCAFYDCSLSSALRPPPLVSWGGKSRVTASDGWRSCS